MSCGQKCSLEQFFGALLTVTTGRCCLRLMADKELGGFPVFLCFLHPLLD
jgi:hypothetical protein